MYFVYVLLSEKDNHLYIGMTANAESRLRRHNNGRVSSTRARRPFKLVYTEEVADRQQARVREKYWKSGIGREKIREQLRANKTMVMNQQDLPACRQAGDLVP